MPQTTADIRFASALSDQTATPAAIEQVVNELSHKLGAPADLMVVFATPHHRDGMELIQQKLSPRVALGVTAEGVIGVRREVEDRPGLSVLAASLPGATLSPFVFDQIDWTAATKDPASLERTLGVAPASVKSLIVLADPMSTPMVTMLPTLGSCFPSVPVVGGMASGARQPGGNRLLLDGLVRREGAVCLAVGGAVRVDFTVSQGCRAIGKPYVITKSQRHIVQELGGRNALAVIQEMLREVPERDTQMVQSNGLLVGRVINEYKGHFGRGDFLIRGVVGVDQDAGYIAIGDPQIRVGQTIQFHVRDQRTAEEDFQLLLEAQKLHGDAGGALLFSCNGRGTRLFDHPDADAAMIHQALGDLPLAGFFAAGEIGPVGKENFVHGHTASLVVFRAEEPNR